MEMEGVAVTHEVHIFHLPKALPYLGPRVGSINIPEAQSTTLQAEAEMCRHVNELTKWSIF